MPKMHCEYVVGVDGCKSGWIAFKVELATGKTCVELADLPSWLKNRPPDLTCLAIDIPIGLLNRPRSCDETARKLLRSPRCNSVFSPPCPAALQATNYEECCATNFAVTGKKISRQSWGIVPKIKVVNDAIQPECQRWAFEVHPEISFWKLAGENAMKHGKKSSSGYRERFDLLRKVFPEIGRHLATRPPRVSKDDLLDAAVAAWTALRLHGNEAQQVCESEKDAKGLEVAIWY